VDADRGTVMIRQGKGRKDRMVPIGERALEWIAKYRDDVRPELAIGGDDGMLFLSNLGESFTPNVPLCLAPLRACQAIRCALGRMALVGVTVRAPASRAAALRGQSGQPQ
jgi:integrase